MRSYCSDICCTILFVKHLFWFIGNRTIREYNKVIAALSCTTTGNESISVHSIYQSGNIVCIPSSYCFDVRDVRVKNDFLQM